MPARDVCRVRVQEATPAEEPPAEEAAAETPAAGDSGQEAPPADEAAADEDAAPKPDGEQALDVDTEDTGALAEPGHESCGKSMVMTRRGDSFCSLLLIFFRGEKLGSTFA